MMKTIPTEQTNNIPAGIWGGNHISMEVTQSGAAIEYDCAHGSIDQPIKPDGSGHFKAQGSHTRERPGPVREGEMDGVPATYTGHVNGTTMSLTITITATRQTIGTFTLTHGRRARIFKCR
ncbi:MAG TPA: hypothetical protein VF708_02215 [Pyrinomonadaceae bacterium]|jgi:hypothetical protein